jgi:hypothetical protein
MLEPARLADLLDRVMTGDPWHADSVQSLLDALSAADASRTPLPGAHSIWELVLHMTGWAREVQARLEGAAAGAPAAGDWPAVADASAGAWDLDRRTLFEVHDALAAAIRRAAPATLD